MQVIYNFFVKILIMREKSKQKLGLITNKLGNLLIKIDLIKIFLKECKYTLNSSTWN